MTHDMPIERAGGEGVFFLGSLFGQGSSDNFENKVHSLESGDGGSSVQRWYVMRERMTK